MAEGHFRLGCLGFNGAGNFLGRPSRSLSEKIHPCRTHDKASRYHDVVSGYVLFAFLTSSVPRWHRSARELPPGRGSLVARTMFGMC
jgi:hypothetical protein